jgi:DNA-binding response OmpR family regulator
MPPRILVVDDEPMVRALIVRVLTDDGYEVVAVHDGRAALDAAYGAEVRYDLVVTNTWLQGASGSDVVHELRKDFPDLPVLHIDDLPPSSRSSYAHLPEDLPTIYKPFRVGDLRRAVRELLGL